MILNREDLGVTPVEFRMIAASVQAASKASADTVEGEVNAIDVLAGLMAIMCLSYAGDGPVTARDLLLLTTRRAASMLTPELMAGWLAMAQEEPPRQ